MAGGERIEVSLTFLTEAEGGRTDTNPARMNGGIYRPHLVADADPENKIGVLFSEGPVAALPGGVLNAVATLLTQSRETLPPNTKFSVHEGSKVVGHGIVIRWV
jgi:hypothetical protein